MRLIAQTERLHLRWLTDADASAMQRVLCDPAVMRYSTGVQTPNQARRWMRDRINEYASLGFGVWAVVARSTGEVIGYCGLTRFPDVNGKPEVELGYRLARQHWGCGFATEAARAARDYAFNTRRLTRLISIIDPDNTASIRIASRLGMRYERDVMLDGYTHPDHGYAITRSAHRTILNRQSTTAPVADYHALVDRLES